MHYEVKGTKAASSVALVLLAGPVDFRMVAHDDAVRTVEFEIDDNTVELRILLDAVVRSVKRE